MGGYRLLVADAADDGLVGLESVDDVNEQADDGQGDEGEADDDVPLCPLEGRSEFWLYGIDAVGVEGVDVEGDDLEGERFGSVGLAVHLDFQFGYEYESRVEGREIVAATEQHALVVVEVSVFSALTNSSPGATCCRESHCGRMTSLLRSALTSRVMPMRCPMKMAAESSRASTVTWALAAVRVRTVRMRVMSVLMVVCLIIMA